VGLSAKNKWLCESVGEPHLELKPNRGETRMPKEAATLAKEKP
jgi:hypothetical protein